MRGSSGSVKCVSQRRPVPFLRSCADASKLSALLVNTMRSPFARPVVFDGDVEAVRQQLLGMMAVDAGADHSLSEILAVEGDVARSPSCNRSWCRTRTRSAGRSATSRDDGTAVNVRDLAKAVPVRADRVELRAADGVGPEHVGAGAAHKLHPLRRGVKRHACLRRRGERAPRGRELPRSAHQRACHQPAPPPDGLRGYR